MPILLNGEGRVAQLVERWPYKPDVAGSSPVPPTGLLHRENFFSRNAWGRVTVLPRFWNRGPVWPHVNLVLFRRDSVKAQVDS